MTITPPSSSSGAPVYEKKDSKKQDLLKDVVQTEVTYSPLDKGESSGTESYESLEFDKELFFDMESKSLGKEPDKTKTASDPSKTDTSSTSTVATPKKVNSIHHYSCIIDAIQMATHTTVDIPSGTELRSKVLHDKVGGDWDEINISRYMKIGNKEASTSNTNKLENMLGEAMNDGIAKARTDVIISDGSHVYVLHDFNYKKNSDGKLLDSDNKIITDTSKQKPVITGFIVKDPANPNGEPILIDKGELDKSNITAFVKGAGDGGKTSKEGANTSANGGKAFHTFEQQVKSRTVNPADGPAGSESQKIRLFFSALGDPRQKKPIGEIIKLINQMGENPSDDDPNLNILKADIKSKLGLDIDPDELKGIVQIFNTDLTKLTGDLGTEGLIKKVQDAKNGTPGKSQFGSSYFNKSGSSKNKVTMGDMFLYMQGELSFQEKPLPEGVNLSSKNKTAEIDATGLQKKTYIDYKTKQIYTVTGFTDDVPPKAKIELSDNVGYEQHNKYQKGIQQVQLSFENFGSSQEGAASDKARSLMMNFNNLINGAEGC